MAPISMYTVRYDCLKLIKVSSFISAPQPKMKHTIVPSNVEQ